MTETARSFTWAAGRQRVHFVMEGGVVTDRLAKLVHRILVLLTIASVVCVVLQTVPEFASAFALEFSIVEALTVAVFTVEYVLRLWCAPDNITYYGMKPWRARLLYIRSFQAVIDLLSILPPLVGWLNLADPHIVTLMRLFRFFKITRYSPGMRSLLAALKTEQRALFAFAVILLGLVLITAGAMYAVDAEHFESIPAAMWWAIVTLTTTGYGDVVPGTLPGRIVASATMILGVMMVALPVGIVATAFANELHKRDFVVNWAMLARVPLFAGLKADEIAEIMPYLRSRNVPAGAMIVRKGEVAQSMFFIAGGEVSVEIPGGGIRLGEGQFFGEMAILRQSRRTADVRAVQATKLLVLDAADFHALVERNPDIGRRVSEVAEKRGEKKAKEDAAKAAPLPPKP